MLWLASGRRIAMKLVALGQLVANAHDWVTPRYTGKISAATHAALVKACCRPTNAAEMNRSAA